MTKRRAPHTKRTPVRAASPILKAIFNEMTARNIRLLEMATAIGKHEARLSEYRRGRVEPGIMTVEHMAAELGYRLTLVPLDQDNSEAGT